MLTQRRLPECGPLIDFDTKLSGGSAFNTNAFANRRVLIKPHRGDWCSYCSAELETFNEIIQELVAFDVYIYALSKDDIQNAELLKSRDGVEFDLLSDPDLHVIRAYGLEHKKALEKTNNPKFKIGGIPVSQRGNHRTGSNVARVFQAVEMAFERQPKRGVDDRTRDRNLK